MSVGPPCDAKLRAASWKPKSIVDWSLPVVENALMKGGPNCWSNTSPKAKKSSMPASLAASRMSGPNFCQNSMLTCLVVSMRNPSTPNSSIQKE